jgi:hypothetical protein
VDAFTCHSVVFEFVVAAKLQRVSHGIILSVVNTQSKPRAKKTTTKAPKLTDEEREAAAILAGSLMHGNPRGMCGTIVCPSPSLPELSADKMLYVRNHRGMCGTILPFPLPPGAECG